ncbi:4Fe-4S dicluster domain-containing protein [Skermania sp. ID1734]|uniref:FAD-dependent oxidoreductase n=1 Tax=Skermania sp. ID1734 TaxID=2597516 RepID=UPI00117FC063|nr:FAD-dependent oxidoreductase [Skermania sp. ID1734]TSD99315.1 4Fe-4S dicluster domain-containing protein [Skermania sp. ID1734]
MPHVVTQSCCSDASCVYACPVNCIHPTPDEPDFLTAEMLHIDPDTCVDCGACVTACPVEAIVPHGKLEERQLTYLSINADFYKKPRKHPLLAPMVESTAARTDSGPLRVAVVGSGPAAMYAADEVLKQPRAQVNVFERLPVPYGLVRSGVAPDHQKTKQVTKLYDMITHESGFEFFLNVEVGKDVSLDELLAHHHAVVYAVGAASDRRLNIPGADLPGVASATDFVGWYNGHPDHAHRKFDLSHKRVVIVGNGNVALDVARILVSDPERLAGTDISDEALAVLRASKVEEVVIVGRRGSAQSAFTVPELSGLVANDDFDVLVDRSEEILDPRTAASSERGHAVSQKLAILDELDDAAAAKPGRRRIVFRYLRSPLAIHGDERVESIEFARGSFASEGSVEYGTDTDNIEAGLVLTSIGYHGVPVLDLPFDEASGTVPNDGGRVAQRPGVYVAGWIKRGPTGFIGTNKSCAHETIEHLIADFNSGELEAPAKAQSDLKKLVQRRQPEVIDRAGWLAIDAEELRRGVERQRVRDKIVDRPVAVDVARRSRRKVGIPFLRG